MRRLTIIFRLVIDFLDRVISCLKPGLVGRIISQTPDDMSVTTRDDVIGLDIFDNL